MLKRFTSFIVVLITTTSFAQPYKTIGVFKPYKWMIGVQWTAIDDDGNRFKNIVDVENSWNLLPYPTQLSIDRYFKYGWSAEFSASYMDYKFGRLINGSTNVSGSFINASLSGKFSFYNMYAPRARWIDPYVTLGIGYTYRSSGTEANVPTINAGGGVNFWIVNAVGIRLNATSNFAVLPKIWDSNGNYLHYSVGLVFRFSSSKKNNGDFGRRKNKWVHDKGVTDNQKMDNNSKLSI